MMESTSHLVVFPAIVERTMNLRFHFGLSVLFSPNP